MFAFPAVTASAFGDGSAWSATIHTSYKTPASLDHSLPIPPPIARPLPGCAAAVLLPSASRSSLNFSTQWLVRDRWFALTLTENASCGALAYRQDGRKLSRLRL